MGSNWRRSSSSSTSFSRSAIGRSGEIAFLYGLVTVSFAFHEIVAQSFEDFSLTVRQGEFDRILLRPITPIVQVLASDFQLKRIGRAITGMLALALALPRVHITWTVGKALSARRHPQRHAPLRRDRPDRRHALLLDD